ncbi:hypothetical protein SAY86_003953 [Trapa natans]|uniref:Uncharacterized protein n=1 Tax=Trapa natans TaxID=22666 RepID=A0AAN7RNB0_TRANT|nr:hypothetical protein SAY86_003953 [Trapa natans]
MWCCGAKGFRPPSPGYHHEVPEGHVRVCVGKVDDDILCVFEMEANYLNHPLFESLLRLSEEELGFSYSGALRIACEIDLFRYVVHLLETSNPLAHYMELSDIVSRFSGSRKDASIRSGRRVSSEVYSATTTFGQLLAEH